MLRRATVSASVSVLVRSGSSRSLPLSGWGFEESGK